VKDFELQLESVMDRIFLPGDSQVGLGEAEPAFFAARRAAARAANGETVNPLTLFRRCSDIGGSETALFITRWGELSDDELPRRSTTIESCMHDFET